MSLETLRSLAAEIAESERLLRQAELDKDETIHLMQQMLDHSPKVIFWKDTSGRILGCNSQCENLLGRSRTDIIGKTVADLFTNSQIDVFQSADHMALRKGEYECDMSFITPTGRIIDARVNVWKSTNIIGDTTGVVIFAYSMTPSGVLE